MDPETSNMALYHKFTMVNMGAEGIIFKAWGGAAFNLYLCSYNSGSSTWGWTETSVTIDNPANVAYTGEQETTTTTWASSAYTSTTLVQAREDPDNYVSGTTSTIWAIYGSGYIQKLSWSSPTLSMTADYVTIPIDKQITVSPEHLDVGRKYIVILSGSHCAADHNVSTISNASVYFFDIANKVWMTCRDLATTNLPASKMDLLSGTTQNLDYWTHSQY